MIYSITFETITPESAEHGDYHDAGFMVEEEEADLRTVIENAQSYGICEDSGDWFSSVDPSHNYYTGEEIFYSLHLKGITPSTYNRIKKLLSY